MVDDESIKNLLLVWPMLYRYTAVAEEAVLLLSVDNKTTINLFIGMAQFIQIYSYSSGAVLPLTVDDEQFKICYWYGPIIQTYSYCYHLW